MPLATVLGQDLGAGGQHVFLIGATGYLCVPALQVWLMDVAGDAVVGALLGSRGSA